MNCCLIRTNTDTAIEIRDRQGRNRVTRADGSADCFASESGQNAHKQTQKRGGGRGGLRQHSALREDCHILKGDEEEERNTDVLQQITQASA